MADDTIRIGYVGAGGNTRLRHLPGFAEIDGVESVSVANRSRESSQRVADEFGLSTVYDSWEELMRRRRHKRHLYRYLALYAQDVGSRIARRRQACHDRGAHDNELGRRSRDAGSIAGIS